MVFLSGKYGGDAVRGQRRGCCGRISKGYISDEGRGSQTDWLFGKNPFGRSLMYGAGRGYQQLFSTFPGTCVGQLPVGIETDGNSDIPYWPGGNQSTYKEVWVTSVAKLFGIIAEIYKNQT